MPGMGQNYIPGTSISSIASDVIGENTGFGNLQGSDYGEAASDLIGGSSTFSHAGTGAGTQRVLDKYSNLFNIAPGVGAGAVSGPGRDAVRKYANYARNISKSNAPYLSSNTGYPVPGQVPTLHSFMGYDPLSGSYSPEGTGLGRISNVWGEQSSAQAPMTQKFTDQYDQAISDMGEMGGIPEDEGGGYSGGGLIDFVSGQQPGGDGEDGWGDILSSMIDGGPAGQEVFTDPVTGEEMFSGGSFENMFGAVSGPVYEEGDELPPESEVGDFVPPSVPLEEDIWSGWHDFWGV